MAARHRHRLFDVWKVTSSTQQTLTVWDVSLGKSIARVAAGPAMSYRRALRVTPDNRTLIGPISFQELGVWDLVSGKQLRSLATGLEGEIIAIALDPEGASRGG